jgi:outer membrane receptor protein involved in Fe transport
MSYSRQMRAAAMLFALLLLWSGCNWADSVEPPPSSPDVVVVAKRLEVENKIDRKVYSISDDALTQFNNLAEVLNFIPSIDVDIDGTVSLRGDANVLILVDGKPSARFSGATAGDSLQAMSAVDIDRIEVLTTPPPEFKAEGVSGVINLITRRHTKSGNGGIVQTSIGNNERANISFSDTLTQGWGSLTVGGGVREDVRYRHMASNVVSTATGNTAGSGSVTAMDETIHRQVPTLNTDLSVNISDTQVVRLSFDETHRDGLRTYHQGFQTTDAVDGVTELTQRLSRGHDPENDVDFAIRFTQNLAQPGASVDTTIHRSLSRQHEQYDYVDLTSIPSQSVNLSGLNFNESHAQTEYAIDWILPRSNSQVSKFGLAVNQDDYQINHAGYLIDPMTQISIINPVLTDLFRFHQSVSALYASEQFAYQGWNFLVGFRGENTTLNGQPLDVTQYFSRRYFKIFPNGHIDHPITDSLNLNIGAARRLSRPYPQSMNPYIDYEYAPSLSAGNPDLQPQITDTLETGVEWTHAPSVTTLNLYRRHNENGVTDVVTLLNNGDTLTTKANLTQTTSYGLEFILNTKLNPVVSFTLTGNAFMSQIDARQLGFSGTRSTTGINLKSKWDWHPDANNSVQIAVVRNDHRLTPQGMVSANTIFNVGYKHLLSQHWSWVATVSDLTNGQKYVRESDTANFSQWYERMNRGRVAYFGAVYSFGNQVAKKSEKASNFDYDAGN